jgi:HD-like signal output (HDOD) protein/CheY-like chemotaxis protein
MNTTTQPFVILLVEDEASDAKLFKYALSENHISVDLHHVSDGCEALEFLRRFGVRFLDAPRPDLILLDLNMPRMGGLECLAAIKHDSSLRDIQVVILSTSHNERDIFASRDLGASDFFTKPMNIHQLVEAVRILSERWITHEAATEGKSHATLQHTVELLEALPALPKIAHEILSIPLSTDKGNNLLLRLIKKDPAILAKIVGLANSPLFGTSKNIMTAADAAAVLGFDRIKMIALSFAMISSMRLKPDGLLDVAHLWRHSITFALAMDELSNAMPKEKRPPAEEIYLAGLLHDIGFLVLDYVDPNLSNRFHEARLNDKTGRLISELETEMLEVNHCELGALLGEHWNLSEAIIAVMRNHHLDDVYKDVVGQPLIAMTHLTEKLLPTFGTTEHIDPDINVEEWLALGIKREHVAEVEAAMLKRAEAGALALG